MYQLKFTNTFKRSYKLMKKRGFDILLLDDILTLTAVDTGTHADLFNM